MRNRQNVNLLLRTIGLVFILFSALNSALYAEGTKTWQPDIAVPGNLYITSPTSNSSGVRSFAGYLSQDNMKMYVHIDDSDNEIVYLGFSQGSTQRGVVTNYEFRIVSPTGAVVHGPFTVGSPNITSYSMAVAGPDVIASGGYPTSNPMFVFDPQGLPSGDYSIEFGNDISMAQFDVTVATKGGSPQAIDGRLWSQAWQVDNGSFNNSLKAMFFARDTKGYVTQVNFAEAGIRPYVGQFSFNDTGTGDTGNPSVDRKSVPNAQSGNPEHQIFLNQPDPNVYPLGVDGEIQNLPLKVEDPANPNITIDVTQDGRVEVVLDFGTLGNYTEAIDKRLFADLSAGVNTIPWDGKRGDGSDVQPQDYPIPVTISYTQGETHFTAYDVEYLDQSFVVRTQTTAGLTSPNVLFWDDTGISQSPGIAPNEKSNTDVGSVARQPWSNFDFGNVNTINTWWFAYRDYQSSTILMPGDYGDAPASYGGAAHKVVDTPTVYLGSVAPDKEDGAIAPDDASGDDADNVDDEDAFTSLPNLSEVATDYSLDVPCVGSATVSGWIDFDQSGSFDNSEKSTASCDTGNASLSWGSLSGLSIGTTYARFRIASDASQVDSPVGGASDGEVEDYSLEIVAPAPVPFTCDGRPYTVIDNPGMLQELNTTTLAVQDLGNFNPAIQFNGIAYNALDNYLYGYARGDGSIPNLHIVRGDADRRLVDLGIPTGSGTFDPINYSGAMDNSGNFYGISSSNLFIIDIGTEPTAGSLTYTAIPRTGDTSTPADITFTIYDDALYGVTGGKLIRISTSGVGSVASTTGDNLPSASGGAWSSSDGSLYFYNNGGGELFKVDVSQSPALVSKVGNVTANGLFDGAACTPPSLKKDASVTETQAGATFSYTYKISNAFNFPITVDFSDTLPATLQYDLASLTDNSPGGGSLTTFTDSILDISGINLSARANVSFTVTVTVDSAINTEQDIDNQAYLRYGVVTLNSDDPDTAAIDDPTRVHVLPVDFGDAPASYGDAGHGVPASTTIYLGSIKPDIDNGSQNTANGGADGSGDDDTGSNDEDSVTTFPELTDIDTVYELDVVVNNTSGNTAHLVGWIDFDGDGIFADDEAATLAVNTGTNGATVKLKWNTIPADIKANDTSYLRLRFTSDNNINTGTANTSQSTGLAADGEVEDYPITIEVGGFTVSGHIYNDNDVNGTKDANEIGIKKVTVVLSGTDTDNNAVCRSTQTGGDGLYRFRIVLPGTYSIYEADGEKYNTPDSCPPTAKDPSGYLSTTANQISNVVVVDQHLENLDFGDAAMPSFKADQSQTTSPNTTVIYPHIFQAKTDGNVDFSIRSEFSNPASAAGWKTTLYYDADCDQVIANTENLWSNRLNVAAGDKVCLIAKVYAPSTSGSGESQQIIIESDFSYGDGTIINSNNIQTVTDLTQLSEAGAGKLSLQKSVQNITVGSNFIDATEQKNNRALPGDTLRYVIQYSNIDGGALDELIINDSIPAFTNLDNSSVQCELPLPDSLTSCTPAINGDALNWTFGGKLSSGAKGKVSYEVTIQ